MNGTVTITVSPNRTPTTPIKIGERIRVKDAYKSFPIRLKSNFMVARMLKKKFVAYFRVTYTGHDEANNFVCHIQPDNF